MHLRSSMLAIARATTLSVGVIVLVTISLGWLYFLEGPTAHWPGPRITDALPLDELPAHAAISLVIFALTMAITGILAGALARALRFDGFAIALSVGVGIGAWIYVLSAISIYVVRQISLDNAFDASRDLPPIYVAGTLFALAVGFTARNDSGDQWITRLVPGSVGILGVIELLVATLPHSAGNRLALGGLLTAPISPVTRTLEVTIGIILMFCARGLSRRGGRALAIAVLLTFVALITRIIDGFNVVGVIVDAVVLLGMFVRRADFANGGDPTTRISGVIRVSALAICAVIYGTIALLINRIAVGLPFHILSALRATLYALLIGAPHQANLIPGGFSEWFPWSLRAIVALGIAWGVSSWFAPWHHRVTDQEESRNHARQLVETWGTDTLAPFTLRGDKALFFYPEPSEDLHTATTLIAYRVVRGVAIVSGDPIGPLEQASPAIESFRAMCVTRGWQFALLGASDKLLPIYKELGLRSLYHGDEAVIDTKTFSLAGGTLKSVRQAVYRVQRNGYRVDICAAGDLRHDAREDLLLLEKQWLAGKKRKGFIMELDELFRLDGDDAIFVVGRDPQGALVGFLEIAVCPASFSLSLSAMPRSPDAPNGFNAFLIVAALDWAREHDYAVLSLNFSPAARLLDRDTPCTGWKRPLRRALLVVKQLLGLQLDNLLIFNRHFAPRWQSRYLIIDKLRHLPRVIVAAMAAERYLPFAEFIRGREVRTTALEPSETPTELSQR